MGPCYDTVRRMHEEAMERAEHYRIGRQPVRRLDPRSGLALISLLVAVVVGGAAI